MSSAVSSPSGASRQEFWAVEPCVGFSVREIEALENTYGNRWPAAKIFPSRGIKWRFSVPCMTADGKFPDASARVAMGPGGRSAKFKRETTAGVMEWDCASPFAGGDVLHISEPFNVRGFRTSKGIGFGSPNYPPPANGHVEIERVRQDGPGYCRFNPSRYDFNPALADWLGQRAAEALGPWRGCIPRAWASFDRLVVTGWRVQRVSEMTLDELEGEGAIPNASRFSDADIPDRRRVCAEDFRTSILASNWPTVAAVDAWIWAFDFKRSFADDLRA